MSYGTHLPAGLALQQANFVLDRLANCDKSFGASSQVPRVAVDKAGVDFVVYDKISYENGASGALAVDCLDGMNRNPVDGGHAYGPFIFRALADELAVESPARTGAILGASIAARSLGTGDTRWASLGKKLEVALRAKAVAEQETVEKCIALGAPMPGFDSFDLLRGLARTTMMLANSSDVVSIRLALSCAETLAQLLRPSAVNSALPNCLVEGSPFASSDRNGSDAAAHINLGTAHGASGVLLAVTHASRRGQLFLDEQPRITRLMQEIANHIFLMRPWEDQGSVPMFGSVDGAEVTLVDPQLRPSWCYGATGHQLSLISAGLLIGDTSVVRHGARNLLQAVRRLERFDDLSLCHGVAGLAVALGVAGRALDDATLKAESAHVSGLLLRSFNPGLDFGYAYTSSGLTVPLSVPGLFNGAAGIAAALLMSLDSDQSVERGVDELSSGAPWIQPAPSRMA